MAVVQQVRSSIQLAYVHLGVEVTADSRKVCSTKRKQLGCLGVDV